MIVVKLSNLLPKIETFHVLIFTVLCNWINFALCCPDNTSILPSDLADIFIDSTLTISKLTAGLLLQYTLWIFVVLLSEFNVV